MKKLLLVALLALAVGTAFADVPNAPRTAIDEAIAPHATGGATGTCSIAYYNLCRWLWVYSGFTPGDQVGVLFDLPLDCGKLPGEVCENTTFWWYWRYTTPNYGYSLTYNLYNLDANNCPVGAPLGTLAGMDPTERWNHYAGLGGGITSNITTIQAMFDKGGLPRMATDNNQSDLGDPTNCPGYVPHTVIHSVTWKYGPTVYCPPAYFADALGPVEIIMDAEFNCAATATQNESWTGVKSLFR
jgi:hypothetical protein